jgi:hypothetical protein
VIPRTEAQRLDPYSRLNYAKVYSIEHHLKVDEMGRVHPQYLDIMRKTWTKFVNDAIISVDDDDSN